MENKTNTKAPFPKSIRELFRQMKGGGATAHPLVQFINYGIVGGAATAVNMIIAFLAAVFIFHALGESDFMVKVLGMANVTVPTVDISNMDRAVRQFYNNLIAFPFSNTFCYILNALWVFKPGKHSKVKEFWLFMAVSGISFTCGTLISFLSISMAGSQTSVSIIIFTVVSVLVNYIARKKIVFNG